MEDTKRREVVKIPEDILEKAAEKAFDATLPRLKRRIKIDEFTDPIMATLEKLDLEVDPEKLSNALKEVHHEQSSLRFVEHMLTTNSGISLIAGTHPETGQHFLSFFVSREDRVERFKEHLLPLVSTVGAELGSEEATILTNQQPTPEEVAARC